MTDLDLHPASKTGDRDYCPLCVERSAEPLPHPLGEADYHTPGTVQLSPGRFIDSGRAFDSVTPAFAVICEKHGIAVLTQTGLTDGWVGVRVRTKHGTAHTRVPVDCTTHRPAYPDPDGYDHVVLLGEYNFHDCSNCGGEATIYARDPPDPDAVEYPSGAFFCDECGYDRE